MRITLSYGHLSVGEQCSKVFLGGSVDHEYDSLRKGLRSLPAKPSTRRLPSILVLRTEERSNYDSRYYSISVIQIRKS
jgi:type IV secretory pathway protease TraF